MSFLIKLLFSTVLGVVSSLFGLAKFALKNFFFLAFLFAAAVGLFFVANFFVNPITLFRPKVALEFDLQALDGGRFISSSMERSSYILFFTGLACKKCYDQAPILEKIKDKYGISVYAIFSDPEDLVVQAAARNRFATRVVLDPAGFLKSKVYAIVAPHLAFVGPDGKILFDITGAISSRELASLEGKIQAVSQ